VEGRSTVEDRRPRNSYHRVCYVFVEQAASECHLSWTAIGDDQCPTEGDSRLRGTREPVHQATDVRAYMLHSFKTDHVTTCDDD